jgi:hypothetical protein
MKQGKIQVTDEQITEAFKSGMTLHKAAVELQLTTVTLWRKAKKLGLEWKSIERQHRLPKVPLSEILNGDHPHFQTFKLKNRLISEGVKENKCEVCNISEWNGLPLIMQLDHIDGDSHNHKLSNLRLICPNCHAQTETYCGKNK